MQTEQQTDPRLAPRSEPASQSPLRETENHFKYLDQAQTDLLTEDPANFILLYQIQRMLPATLSVIKEELARNSELLPMLEKALHDLEAQGLIRLEKDMFVNTSMKLRLSADPDRLKRVLPHVMARETNRVITHALNKFSHRKMKEAVFYMALPDDEQTALETEAAYREFRLRLEAIAERAKTRVSPRVRYVGVVSSSTNAEEYL